MTNKFYKLLLSFSYIIDIIYAQWNSYYFVLSYSLQKDWFLMDWVSIKVVDIGKKIISQMSDSYRKGRSDFELMAEDVLLD